MSLRKQLTIGLALTGLAVGLTTVQANAQPVLKGTFELPTAAYFGNTLLQPGQYTIWMSTEVRDIARVPTIHQSGEEVTANALTIDKQGREHGRNNIDR